MPSSNFYKMESRRNPTSAQINKTKQQQQQDHNSALLHLYEKKKKSIFTGGQRDLNLKRQDRHFPLVVGQMKHFWFLYLHFTYLHVLIGIESKFQRKNVKQYLSPVQ